MNSKQLSTSTITAVVVFLFVIRIEANSPKPSCSSHNHCSSTLSCHNGFCKNPCAHVHDGQICTVKDHIATFSCKPGFGHPQGTDRICLPSKWSCYVDEEDINRSIRCEIPYNGSRSLPVRLCVS